MTPDNKTVYAYLRVSSDEQDVNSQRQGVEEFANSHGWTIDETITDEGVSGGKDPDKRKLGPLLEGLKKDDIIIAAEISRLGRDLYMIMDILHHCMKRECAIYTVKDRFTLGNDIQSKVLAFAFGLSAEIERQMIRQRTKEGLMLRKKQGVLMGRPSGRRTSPENDEVLKKLDKMKDEILVALEWGASMKEIAKKAGVDRNTLYRKMLMCWGYYDGQPDAEERKAKWTAMENRQVEAAKEKRLLDSMYGDPVPFDEERLLAYIRADLTVPEIARHYPDYTYDQVYDTISLVPKFEKEYRKHGHLIARKKKKA